MPNIRVIPKLEVKGENLIKGMHLEGLRVVGKPETAALEYYEQGADELIYIDLVASLYQRDSILGIVERTAQKVFIPLTVGGGIRTFEDVKKTLRAGADKVALNTGAILRPELITEIATAFGSQCMVISLEVQRKIDGTYQCYTDCGRTPTGIDPVEWAQEAVRRGAGEVLLTSINQDGTFKGYDLDLIKKISSVTRVPLIVSGGAASPVDMEKAVLEGKADAVCASAFFHFKRGTIQDVKNHLQSCHISVRQIE